MVEEKTFWMVEKALKDLIAAAEEAVYRNPHEVEHELLEAAVEEAKSVLKLSGEAMPMEGRKTVS